MASDESDKHDGKDSDSQAEKDSFFEQVPGVHNSKDIFLASEDALNDDVLREQMRDSCIVIPTALKERMEPPEGSSLFSLWTLLDVRHDKADTLPGALDNVCKVIDSGEKKRVVFLTTRSHAEPLLALAYYCAAAGCPPETVSSAIAKGLSGVKGEAGQLPSDFPLDLIKNRYCLSQGLAELAADKVVADKAAAEPAKKKKKFIPRPQSLRQTLDHDHLPPGDEIGWKAAADPAKKKRTFIPRPQSLRQALDHDHLPPGDEIGWQQRLESGVADMKRSAWQPSSKHKSEKAEMNCNKKVVVLDLQALPSRILQNIILMVVGISGKSLNILPLVSQALLRRLQDLSLAVGHLHGKPALSALQQKHLAVDGKRAWSLHKLDLSFTQVCQCWQAVQVCTLNLCFTQVSDADVSALEGCLSLHTLILRKTNVMDVSVLASCASLHTLDLSRTKVSDVSVLASCSSLHTLGLASCSSLHMLSLSDNGVMDVSVLASCSSLHTLNLSNNRVIDVSALVGCSNLHKLDLSGTQVMDVSVLAGCSNLHALILRRTNVNVLSLAGCSNLHTLNLGGTEVMDVSVLVGFSNLHTLHISFTAVMDVSALAGCSCLHTLNIAHTQVRDVSALVGCTSLHTLYAFHAKVTKLPVLAGCSSLHTLDLSSTDVMDVDVLALVGSTSLHTLDLSHTRVSDVSVLAGCTSLHTLNLSHTRVSDVSVLVGCTSLHRLDFSHARVSDVSVLEGCTWWRQMRGEA